MGVGVRAATLGIALAGGGGAAIAQEVAPAASTSPSTDAAERPPVAKWFVGDFLVQYGVRNRFRPREVGTKSASYAAPFAFWIQVTERASVELDVDTVLAAKNRRGESLLGLGDTYLTVQYDPVWEEGRRPFVGVAYSVKLPTASAERGLGSGAVDHNPYVVFGKTVRPGTWVEAAVGGYFEGDPDAGGYTSVGTLALVLRQKLPPRISYRGVVTATTRSSTTASTVSSLHRFDVRLRDNVVLVGGVNAGLTSTVPRFGWLAGVRYEANFRDLFGK
jgi:hypothetical protein